MIQTTLSPTSDATLLHRVTGRIDVPEAEPTNADSFWIAWLVKPG